MNLQYFQFYSKYISFNITQFTFRNDTRYSEDDYDFTKWPIFVPSMKSRGTVSSSLLTLNHEGKVEFIERSWTESGELNQESRKSFMLS